MTPRVWWSKSVPPEIREAVEPHVERWAFVLPGWVHELGISYDPNSANCAETKGDIAYRRAHIYVGPHFVQNEGPDREEIIRHELAHVVLHPLTDWTKDIVSRLAGDDERLAEWLREEWRQRLEGATCDIEAALLRTRRGSS